MPQHLFVVVLDDNPDPIHPIDIHREIRESGIDYAQHLDGTTFDLLGGVEAGGVTVARDDSQRWLWLTIRRGELVTTPIASLEGLRLRLGWLNNRQAA